jgi:hypothetical protein
MSLLQKLEDEDGYFALEKLLFFPQIRASAMGDS